MWTGKVGSSQGLNPLVKVRVDLSENAAFLHRVLAGFYVLIPRQNRVSASLQGCLAIARLKTEVSLMNSALLSSTPVCSLELVLKGARKGLLLSCPKTLFDLSFMDHF